MSGYNVLVIWDFEIKNKNLLFKKIEELSNDMNNFILNTIK
jgi:G:T-mismatch repair DNA endonuclease (very short patch repair protein)